MPNQQTHSTFFRKITITVGIFVLIYSSVYFWLGAYASAILQLVTNIICTPLILSLQKHKNYANLSRFIFLASSSLYIYAAPMGIPGDAVADFYFLPATLLTLVVFESYQKKQISIAILFPLLAWIMIHLEVFPPIPKNLLPLEFPISFFRHANFIGSFILIVLIIKYFNEHIENLKQTAIEDLVYINNDLLRAEKEARQALEVAEYEREKSAQNARLATLGELSAGIAHEINNPLAILSGNLSILQTRNEELQKIESRIVTMQKAVDRITKIVGGLRKFSRNATLVPKQPHLVSNLISEVLTLTSMKSKKSFVSIEIDCQTQSKILCDEIEIGQVLINLINNAIDAVKRLNEKWVRILAFDQDEHVILQIRDSGKGIPPEIADKLFQAFFTTKPVGEGTGLGLSIIKNILEEHDAKIELKKDDPNTCFEIKFKRAI